MSKTTRIICICSGNICRSPMAVALLKRRLDRREIAHLVISGGTLGIRGRRAAPFARAAITEFDPDLAPTIEGHRSQGLSPSMLAVADHLLVMSPAHARHVVQLRPEAKDKLVALWEYAPPGAKLRKIPDPVGHDRDVFRHSLKLIDQCLQNWLDDHYGRANKTSSE